MLTTQGKEKHRKSGYLVDSLKNVLRKGPVPYIYGLPGSLRERIQSRGKKTKGMNDESSLLMTLPVNKGNKPVSSFKETNNRLWSPTPVNTINYRRIFSFEGRPKG